MPTLHVTIGPNELKRLKVYAKTSRKTDREIVREAVNVFLNKRTRTILPIEPIGRHVYTGLEQRVLVLTALAEQTKGLSFSAIVRRVQYPNASVVSALFELAGRRYVKPKGHAPAIGPGRPSKVWAITPAGRTALSRVSD